MMTERDELDAIAGEYVLGVLSDAERDAFEDRLRRDDRARAALRNAEQRFSELDLTASAARAPSGLWDRINARLDEKPVARDNVVPLRPLGGATPKMDVKRAAPGRFWQGFAAAALVALLGFGALWTSLTSAQPELIVVLLDAQSQPGAIVEAYNGQRVRVVPLAQFNVPEGKTLQVWTLPNREMGPVSIGLLEGARTKTLIGPSLPAPRPEQLYEITLEQAGGSPTGRPTGPILAKGFARAPQI